MAGFVDLFRRLLGWRSSYNASIGGPYYVDQRQFLVAGAKMGGVYATSAAVAQVYHSGATQGESDGRS